MESTEAAALARPAPQRSERGALRWGYELAMAGLAIVNLSLIAEHQGWGNHVNLAIWAVFAVDYLVRLQRAPDRRDFFRRNLADLVVLVPIDFFRGARLLRLVRLVRALRALEVLTRVGRSVGGVLRTNGLGYVILFTALVMVAGGVLIREFEPQVGSLPEALWWSVATTTTVGYAEIAPKTTGGRAVAAVLWLVGIGTVGMITASIATYFLASRRSRNSHVRHVQSELERWDEMTPEERRTLVSVMAALSREE
jgi:voltage-gated potassium channel